MKWSGASYKRLLVRSIICDVADIKRRMKQQHVIDLAADIEAAGGDPIHAPTIRESDHKLICGRDRMAALMINKAKRAWVHVAECDDAEAAQLERRENLYRRHMEKGEFAKALAELIELKKQALRAAQERHTETQENSASEDPTTPQFEKKITAAARKEIARESGRKTHSIRVAQARAAEPAPPPEPELTEETAGGKIELPPGFKTFDLDVPLASRSVIAETAVWLGDWAQTMNGLLRELTEMEKKGPYAVAPAHIQKIRDAFQGAGHAVREAIPASLCFYCKAQPAATPNCSACGGTGVVGRHGGDNVPPEAKLVGEKARIALGGKWVLVGAAANAAEAAPPAKKSRGIRVTNEHGQEIPLDDDNEPAFA
jgi:hypothetical protein